MMIQARLGQPPTGSPQIKVLQIITIIIINAMKQNRTPKNAAMVNGTVVKATIPSMAYLNNFQKDHFVSPATLSTFSNSNHFVLYPTKLHNPFE